VLTYALLGKRTGFHAATIQKFESGKSGGNAEVRAALERELALIEKEQQP